MSRVFFFLDEMLALQFELIPGVWRPINSY